MLLQGADQVVGILEGARNLTLTGALLAAVVTLWKSTSKKDEQLLEATKTVTAALTTVASSQTELRIIIEKKVVSDDQLSKSIQDLRVDINRNFHCAIVEDSKHLGAYGQDR